MGHNGGMSADASEKPRITRVACYAIVVDGGQAEDESKAQQHDRRQDHRPR